MAEFGAHLTSTSTRDRPSAFDLVAQESLMTTLRPALRHACKVLAESYPERLGWLIRVSDEIYTLFDLILQNYYLRKYDASFAENFYGLRRTQSSDSPQATDKRTKLSSSALKKSLLFLVLVPYVKVKLDHLFESIRLQVADGQHTSQRINSQLCRSFVTIYPWINLIWEGTSFGYLFLYTFEKVKHHSQLTHLAGVVLQMLTEDDLEVQESRGHDQKNLSHLSILSKLWVVFKRSLSYLAILLSTGLSIGVFFLQFLEWWYNNDQNTPAAVTSLPVPNAPKKQDCDTLPSICPLCNRIRTNDTVLAVSGYVFCYPCIYNHVKSNRKCPITGYPCEMEHLVKLYLPDG